MGPEIVIPVIAIVMTFGMPIAIVAIIQINKARNNAELQKTLRMSIEKGQPLPPEFVDSIQRSVPKAKNPMNDIRGGLVLLAVAAHLGRIDGGLWFGQWRIGPWLLHPLALVYALSGSLMISKTLRIPKP